MTAPEREEVLGISKRKTSPGKGSSVRPWKEGEGCARGRRSLTARWRRRHSKEDLGLLRLFQLKQCVCALLCTKWHRLLQGGHKVSGEVGFLGAMMKDAGLLVPGQSGADTESNAHDYTFLARLVWGLIMYLQPLTAKHLLNLKVLWTTVRWSWGGGGLKKLGFKGTGTEHQSMLCSV